MKRFLDFLKQVLATFLGMSIFFLFLLGTSVRLMRNSIESRNKEIIPPNTKQVLRVKLEGRIDHVREHDQIGLALDKDKVYTRELGLMLAKAAKDDDIEAVLIEMHSFRAGLVTLERLGKMIQKFKESGKSIICYSPVECGQSHLYLGSYADFHMVHPLVNVCLEGFSIKSPYFRNTLDWIGIEAYAFYGGDTKSGLDSFVRTSMKPAVKRKYLDLILDMQELIHTGIAKQRHIDMNLLDEIADLLWISVWEALEVRLIDGVGYIKDVERVLQKDPYYGMASRTHTTAKSVKKNKKKAASLPSGIQNWQILGKSSSAKTKQNQGTSDNDSKKLGTNKNGVAYNQKQESDDNALDNEKKVDTIENDHEATTEAVPTLPIHFVSLEDYINRINKKSKKRKQIQDKKIEYGKRSVGYIYLRGKIVNGESRPGYIGSEDTVKMLYAAADLYDVLVISIDSRGGDAIASDSIRAAVADIANNKEKFVIVVMENICASGGVMIALGANRILCYRGTITLSIGVFSGMFHARNLLANRFRIGVDGVKTNRSSDIHQGSAIFGRAMQDRGLSRWEKIQWQGSVDDMYDYFLTLASRNGKLSEEQVEAIAGGFVCLGEEAAYYGIVDKVIDNLEDAIREFMLQKYHDEDYTIYYHVHTKSNLKRILKRLRGFFTKSLFGMRLYRKYHNFVKSMQLKTGKQAYANMSFGHDSNDENE